VAVALDVGSISNCGFEDGGLLVHQGFDVLVVKRDYLAAGALVGTLLEVIKTHGMPPV
jgi:hypothetical protein